MLRGSPLRSALLDPRRSGASRDQTLADRVFEWLAGEIVNGTLRPGQWVSENEVAALLGVSRSPVRDAFRGLAREGLVEVRRRRGTIMSELSANEADDLYRARQLVEAEMAGLAVEHMSDEHVDELSTIVESMRQAVGTSSEVFECTRRLWQMLMDLCPNGTIRELVAMLWRRSIRLRGIVASLPHMHEDTLLFFEELLEVCRARDATAARAVMASQQDRVRRRLLEEVFIDLGSDGRIPRQFAARPRAQSSSTGL